MSVCVCVGASVLVDTTLFVQLDKQHESSEAGTSEASHLSAPVGGRPPLGAAALIPAPLKTFSSPARGLGGASAAWGCGHSGGGDSAVISLVSTGRF